jgi:hypothetical protein
MTAADYPTVAMFSNSTAKEIRLYLEMMCEEVILAPGHSVDLLAKPLPDLLPLAIHQVEGGMQVIPFQEIDPNWHVRFRGKILKAAHPLRLAEHE